jgi:hypothetical protein
VAILALVVEDPSQASKAEKNRLRRWLQRWLQRGRPSSPKDAEEHRVGRHYGTSPLPVVAQREDEGEASRLADVDREVRLAVYGQICDSWRMLTDVRFKLLALVPSLSAVGLALTVGSSRLFNGSWETRLAAALFGLAVSGGLWMYDRRNNELYNDLISRGRRVEGELGVDTGVFRGRPNPVRQVISHSPATTLVYGAVFAAWVSAAVYVALTR